MPTQTATRSRRRSRSSRSRAGRRRSKRRSASSRRRNGLPGWRDVGGAVSKTEKRAAKARLRALDRVPSLRFGLWVLIGCLAVTAYVGHVYATQTTLTQLNEARALNERLHLKNQRLQSELDQMTGPGTVIHRAERLGLEEGISYGPTIQMDGH